MEKVINVRDLFRIDNDSSGCPRFVIHFLWISQTYEDAIRKAKQIGGKKFHNKQYGGGISFAGYSPEMIAQKINNLLNS